MQISCRALARNLASGLVLLGTLLGACAAPRPTAGPASEVPPGASPTIQSSAPTAPAAPTAAPEVEVNPLAGLTFSTAAGFWLIDAQGVPQLVVDHSRAHLSPDGRRVVYQAPAEDEGADDVWVMDLATGQQRNLTKTGYRFEENPQWWPGRPEILVFSSDVECCMASRELPTTVGLGGSEYKIIDENNGGPRALSPDGQLMAYSSYQSTGWLYRFGGTPEVFDPAAYGLRVEKLFQPAFSPDGKRLAWRVSGDFDRNGKSDLAIAVFDLQAKTSTLLHVYSPAGGSEAIEDIAWSPDGAWLAFTTQAEPPATGRALNLWVTRPDGSEEKFLASGSSPVWNPDSQLLAFLEATTSGQPEPRLVGMATFTVQPLSTAVPEGILFLLDWVRP